MHNAQRKDVRIVECITDAKGDRSRPPGKQDDPDAYTRVVERRTDGVVIRGAKLHITGASMAHDLMVIPTKAMKPGEEAYAIGCAHVLAGACFSEVMGRSPLLDLVCRAKPRDVLQGDLH